MVAASSYSYKLLERWQTSGGSEWYAEDLAAVTAGLHGVVLPKTDDPAKIAMTVAASPAGVSVLPRSGGCRVPRLQAVDAWVRSTSGDLDSEGESDVETASYSHRGVEGYWPRGRRSSQRQRPRADWARTHCADRVS